MARSGLPETTPDHFGPLRKPRCRKVPSLVCTPRVGSVAKPTRAARDPNLKMGKLVRLYRREFLQCARSCALSVTIPARCNARARSQRAAHRPCRRHRCGENGDASCSAVAPVRSGLALLAGAATGRAFVAHRLCPHRHLQTTRASTSQHAARCRHETICFARADCWHKARPQPASWSQ